jgi:hypothetical protein
MRRTLAIAAALLGIGVSTLGATTLIRMDFGDLARDANLIVVGTVKSVEGRWDDTLTFVHSDVTLNVEQSLRGNAPSEVVLSTPGGQIGGIAQRADGAATFEPGERVLVFLTTWEDGSYKVLGYEQGKSRLLTEQDGRERLRGGVVDGRTLDGVVDELRHGPNYNIPLRRQD